MTTREFTPRLDRQISREVTTTVEVSASTAYAYDTQELQTGDRVSDGAWRRDSDTELAIGLNDSNGLSFPDLTTPTSGVEVAFDGAAATTLTITDMGFLRNPFGQILGIQLTFDGPLPAAGAMLTIMIPTGRDADGYADGPAARMGSEAGLLRAGLLPGGTGRPDHDPRHAVYRED